MKQIMRKLKPVILVSAAVTVATMVLTTITLCCISEDYIDSPEDEING